MSLGLDSLGLSPIGLPPAGASAPAPQLLLPAADNALGGWLARNGGALYAQLDESPTPDDTDDIYATDLGALCEIALAAGTDPQVSADHIVSYRAQGSVTLRLL